MLYRRKLKKNLKLQQNLPPRLTVTIRRYNDFRNAEKDEDTYEGLNLPQDLTY
jgi:hypothetical protein